MKTGKNGSAPSVSGGRARTSPTAYARDVEKARARWLGVQPSDFATSRIRARVSSATPGRSLRAKDTAPFDTPAACATSEIVGRARFVTANSLSEGTLRVARHTSGPGHRSPCAGSEPSNTV